MSSASFISWNFSTEKESFSKPEKIERLPVFGDCERDSEEKRQMCSSVSLRNFFKDNMKYPAKAKEQGIEGKVIIETTITADGKMENVHVQKTANKELNAEALRLVNELGKWTPAQTKKNKPVPARIFIPVNFRKNSDAFKR